MIYKWWYKGITLPLDRNKPPALEAADSLFLIPERNYDSSLSLLATTTCFSLLPPPVRQKHD